MISGADKSPPNGSSYGTEEYLDLEDSRILISALTEFILPLLSGRTTDTVFKSSKKLTSLDVSRRSASESNDMPYEATQLVDALKAFVNYLCHQRAETPKSEEPIADTPISNDEKIEVAEEDVTINQQRKSDTRPTYLEMPRSSEVAILDVQKQKELFTDAALADVRHMVFNRMPIRLLMFNEEGAEIRLVERSEVYRHISSLIRRDINALDSSSIVDNNMDLVKHGPAAISRLVSTYAQYAILSHTWLPDTPGEVTYRDWHTKTYDTESPSYKKLARFCLVSAVNHGLTLAWMDTLCINKDSSSELDESIRSMYKWYRNSKVCIAYLSDTMALEEMHNDTWFTRGWTLQELLAPQMIKFYGLDWSGLGNQAERSDKEDSAILLQILRATTITHKELSVPLKDISISRRMQWAALRRVAREEDTAYALMGIFNISIATAYGEGVEYAFTRLVREILLSSDAGENVLEIANWGGEPNYSDPTTIPSSTSCLIPVSPRAYDYRCTQRIRWYMSLTPLTLTRVGLHVSVLLMPAWEDVLCSASAENSFTPEGSFYATVTVQAETPGSLHGTGVYRILDSRTFSKIRLSRSDKGKVFTSSQKSTVFAVLNFEQTESKVVMPLFHLCFSVMLDFSEINIESAVRSRAYSRRMTRSPTIFQLKERRQVPLLYCKIPKSDLYKHGIVLQTMYL